MYIDCTDKGSGLNVVTDDGLGGSRTGSVVLLKPGSAGGGKDTDFWFAFSKLVRTRRLSMILETPKKDSDPKVKALSQGESDPDR